MGDSNRNILALLKFTVFHKTARGCKMETDIYADSNVLHGSAFDEIDSVLSKSENPVIITDPPFR